jgi:hypothetical protein
MAMLNNKMVKFKGVFHFSGSGKVGGKAVRFRSMNTAVEVPGVPDDPTHLLDMDQM